MAKAEASNKTNAFYRPNQSACFNSVDRANFFKTKHLQRSASGTGPGSGTYKPKFEAVWKRLRQVDLDKMSKEPS